MFSLLLSVISQPVKTVTNSTHELSSIQYLLGGASFTNVLFYYQLLLLLSKNVTTAVERPTPLTVYFTVRRNSQLHYVWGFFSLSSQPSVNRIIGYSPTSVRTSISGAWNVLSMIQIIMMGANSGRVELTV